MDFDILQKKSKKSIVLVVSPLIALMNDPVDAINAMGISAIKIGSSNTIELKDHIKHGDFQVVFISPEINYHLNGVEQSNGLLQKGDK